MTHTEYAEGRCWSCGVDQLPQRPRREDYESDPAFLVASLTWLDYAFPRRADHRRRVAEWERLELETHTERVAERIRELIALPEWDEQQQAEGDRLAADYLKKRRTLRQKKGKSA